MHPHDVDIMLEGDCTLKKLIEEGKFFELSTKNLVRILEEEYPDELDRLKTAYFIPDAKTLSATPSPAIILFDDDYDEINRTLVSILALRWIHNADYPTFVRNQPPGVRLTRESFDWISDIFKHNIKTDDDLYALVTSVVINDLGKSETLASDFKDITHDDISRANHDMILYRVVNAHPQLIPSLGRLSPEQILDMILGIRLGAEFNFGQLAQVENVPASLSGLQALEGHSCAFQKRFMEQILDLAGASGHIDHTCAKKLTEPVFQSYKNVYEVALHIIARKTDLRGGYDMILKRKVDLLVNMGWTNGRKLDIHRPKHRSLMRLLCVCNAADAEQANMVDSTFTDCLDKSVRKVLVQGMDADGISHRPAIQATYIPAVCSAAMRNTNTNSKAERQAALAAVFRYLARTLIVTDRDTQKFPQNVRVIEKDLRRTCLDIVKSREFRERPDVLDIMDILTGEVGLMEGD